jgi:hypothetical protein
LGTGLQLTQFNNPTSTKTETKNMTTPHLRKSIGRSPLRLALLLIPSAIALAWFALSPTAHSQACFSNCSSSGNVANTALGTNVLINNTSGAANTGIGYQALRQNTSGSANTASGYQALIFNTTGGGNTANGAGALESNTTGSDNTANGGGALTKNTAGSDNTANGGSALGSNTGGSTNTANGFQALLSNTTGNDNTANGARALGSNTTGNENTATGINALLSNTTGNNNTANGQNALQLNTTGINNTANGAGALQVNSGNDNTANGANALGSNSTGNNNTANGIFALEFNTSGHDNTAEGFNALGHNTTGSSNIALGSNGGNNLTTGSNNIDIGNLGVAGEANHIRIGTVGTQKATFIAGIHGVTVAGGVGVIVGTNGQLGTTTSSERFKDEIKPMDKASDAILALKPVTFRYKKELDPDGIPQFGLVAEQVEKVNPDLVVRGEDGKVMTVRYDAVNAMLLNEFLKEHRRAQVQERKVEEQGATIAQQQKAIADLTAQLKDQAALIRRVSDRFEVSKAAPQLVADNQ